MIQALCWLYIRTPEEFYKLNGTSERITLLNDIYLPSDFYPIEFKAELRGNGHTITAFSPIFGDLDTVILYNLTINTSAYIARNVLTSAFHTVNICATGAAIPFNQLSSCQFKSMLYNGTNVLVNVSLQTDYLGSAFVTLYNKQASGNISGVVTTSQSDRFMNVYFANQLEIENCPFIAGVAVSAKFTIFKSCKIISNITVSFGDRTNIGGLASYASAVNITDCDVVVFVQGINVTGDIGGLVGQAYCPYNLNKTMYMHNSSVTAKYAINTDIDEFSAFYAYGGIAGRVPNKNIEFVKLSVFLEILITNSMKNRTIFGGIVGADQSGANYLNCYAFGYINGTISSSAAVGGFFGTYKGLTNVALTGCVSNVFINLTVGFGSLIGGFGGEAIYYSRIVDSYATGRIFINLLASSTNSTFIGGFTGIAAETVSNCYSTTQVTINVPQNAQYLFVGGFSGAAINSTIYYCFCNTYVVKIEIKGQAGLFAGGFIGTSSGSPAVLTDSYAVIYDFTVSVASVYDTAYYAGIGGFAGYSNGTKLTNAFARVNSITSLPAKFLIGSIAAQVESTGVISNAYSTSSFANATDVPLLGAGTIGLTAVFVDCTKAGNKQVYDYCRSDCKTEKFATDLGSKFVYKMEYNDGYPHLLDPAAVYGNEIIISSNYLLFPQGYWYKDSTGLIFRQSDFYICRSACYGTYTSPNDHICTDAATAQGYCIKLNGITERLRQSACSGASECKNGVTYCKLHEELIDGDCTASCSGCVTGVCLDKVCRCDPYVYGVSCDMYNCSADNVTCFGVAECMADSLQCKCASVNEYVDTKTGTCIAGCKAALKEGAFCVGAGLAYCSGAVRKDSQCENKGLSIGAIVGISVGAVLVLIAVVVGVYLCLRKKSRRGPKLYAGVSVDRIVIQPEIQMI